MNIDDEIENLKQIQTAIAVIMRTFKKQTPEKPRDVSKSYTGERVGTCICGYDGILEHQNYCCMCGQKLDWEGVKWKEKENV